MSICLSIASQHLFMDILHSTIQYSVLIEENKNKRKNRSGNWTIEMVLKLFSLTLKFVCFFSRNSIHCIEFWRNECSGFQNWNFDGHTLQIATQFFFFAINRNAGTCECEFHTRSYAINNVKRLWPQLWKKNRILNSIEKEWNELIFKVWKYFYNEQDKFTIKIASLQHFFNFFFHFFIVCFVHWMLFWFDEWL